MTDRKCVYLIGGFHEMVELLEDLGYEILGIVDHSASTCQVCMRHLYLGSDSFLLEAGPSQGGDSVVVSPDEPALRERLASSYLQKGFRLEKVCFPQVSAAASISCGVVIQRHAHISPGCEIDVGVKVNVGALIMHDVKIKAFATVAPAAVLLGGVRVGRRAYIGANATVMPGVVIGDDVIVGAGAVVTTNVPEGLKVAGVPARVLE